jgi:hypothetical protein
MSKLDDFERMLKLLHESTHNEKMREAILMVLDYKIEYLKTTTMETYD